MTSDAGDEVAILPVDPGSATAVLADSTPIEPKTGTVLSKYSVRLDDRKCIAPPVPEPSKEHTEYPVVARELKPPVFWIGTLRRRLA